MKNVITTTVILLLTIGFLVIGNTTAEARHNDGATVRAGATIVFGQPFVNVVARVYSGPEYGPVHYRPVYPSARYVERTKIIYAGPQHKIHRHRDWDHGKRYRDYWCRQEHRHDRDDSWRDHRRHRDN